MSGYRTLKAGLLVLACVAGLGAPAQAEERVTLGWGRMFHNDAMGDGNDRWQTGGYTVSMLRGVSFDGSLPATPGEILEFRLAANIMAPANLSKPAADDRRYAGALSFGVHTHFDWKATEISLGADLVATGPQTGIGRFQTWVHERLDMPVPGALDDQIGNGFHPTFQAEAGRSYAIGNGAARPFVQMQAGAETLVRMGADLTFGGFGQGDLMVRDTATGLRYRAVEGDRKGGVSFVLGGDVAHVFDSIYLPDGGGVTMTPDRLRLRAGMHWQGVRNSVFYGVSYLSPEFEEQSSGQLVGGLSVNLKF